MRLFLVSFLCPVIALTTLPFKPEWSIAYILLIGGKITRNIVIKIQESYQPLCRNFFESFGSYVFLIKKHTYWVQIVKVLLCFNVLRLLNKFGNATLFRRCVNLADSLCKSDCSGGTNAPGTVSPIRLSVCQRSQYVRGKWFRLIKKHRGVKTLYTLMPISKTGPL